MSGTIDIHRPAADADPTMPAWMSLLIKVGLPTFAAVVLGYVLIAQVLIPDRDAARKRNEDDASEAKAFRDAIVEVNKGNMEINRSNATTNATIATTLKKIDENSSRTLEVLQRMEVDQRRGAWNEPRPKGGSGE